MPVITHLFAAFYYIFLKKQLFRSVIIFIFSLFLVTDVLNISEYSQKKSVVYIQESCRLELEL